MAGERFSDFDEQRPTRAGLPGPSFFAGLFIVFIGAILLLERFGYLDSEIVFRYWPFALVAAGVYRALTARTPGTRVFGGILALAGLGIFLHQEGYIRLDWDVLWPLILIVVGLNLLLKSLRRSRSRRDYDTAEVRVLGEWVLFGGGRLVNTSQDFRGGEVFAMFGGYEVDLTKAAIRDGEVEIQANAIFGGVEIHVPRDWTVSTKGIPIFGGYEDKRAVGAEATDPKQCLVIRGMAIFGGVEINSKGSS